MGSEFTETFYPPVTADRRTAVETKLHEIRAQLYRHGGGYSSEDVDGLLQLSAELTLLLKKLTADSPAKQAAKRHFKNRTWPKRRTR